MRRIAFFFTLIIILTDIIDIVSFRIFYKVSCGAPRGVENPCLPTALKTGRGKSKFEYLYEQIREDILKGTLKPGEKLPSKRALAEHLGISVITVEGAYGQLLDEGYIVSRPRSGFFVSEISLPSGSIAPDIPQTVELQNVGSGRLPREETTGASGDFPVSTFLRLIREVLNDYGDKLLRRPPNAGCPELREAISAYLERYRGMKTEPEQIIIGSGSEYLYGLIAQLIDPGTIFALEEESLRKDPPGIPRPRNPLRAASHG